MLVDSRLLMFGFACVWRVLRLGRCVKFLVVWFGLLIWVLSEFCSGGFWRFCVVASGGLLVVLRFAGCLLV